MNIFILKSIIVEYDWVSGRLGDEQLTQGAGGSDVVSCSEIFSGLNVDESCLEFYDVNNGMGNADSTVIDDSMSVEIELAMEKAGIGMCYAKEEEFDFELLDNWNNILIEGVCVRACVRECVCVCMCMYMCALHIYII